MILCCKSCPLWQKTSAPILGSVKQKELPPPKPEVSALADPRRLYQKTSIIYISNGKMEKSPEQLLLSCVGCRFPPSAIVRRFTKKPSCCKRVFLQEPVLFRRGIFWCFQMRKRAFVHRFCMEKAGVLWYHFLKAKKQVFYRKVHHLVDGCLSVSTWIYEG